MSSYSGLNFPDSANVGDTFTDTRNGTTYKYIGGDIKLLSSWQVIQSGTDAVASAIAIQDKTSLTPAQVLPNEGKLVVSSKPYLYDIAEGAVPNHVSHRVSGFVSPVNNVEIAVFPVAAVYVFPDIPMQMEVVSASANDTLLGTGIQKVMVHYLDNNYLQQTEEVIMDGTNAVATVATNIIRVNCVHASQVGTGKVAAGNIDIRHLTNSPVYSRISAGRLTCQSSVFTIPANYDSAYITAWHVGVGAASAGHYGIFRLGASITPMGVVDPGNFYIQDIAILQDGHVRINFNNPKKMLPRTDIWVTVISDAGAAAALATAAYGMYFEPIGGIKS